MKSRGYRPDRAGRPSYLYPRTLTAGVSSRGYPRLRHMAVTFST